MRMITQDNKTGEVKVFDILDIYMVDTNATAYLIDEVQDHCYNPKPVYFKD